MAKGFGEELSMTLTQASERLSSRAYELDNLAEAFARTGNNPVAGQLYSVAADLRDMVTKIGAAWGQHVSEMVNRADEASHNLIRAVLVGQELEGSKGD